MGIFSLFGKKDRRQATSAADKTSSRKKRDEEDTRINANTETSRSLNFQVQRKVAQATAMKIDAIESEMSSEFVKPTLTGDTAASPPPAAKALDKLAIKAPSAKLTKPRPDTSPASPLDLPTMGTTIQFLLDKEPLNSKVALSASETAPAIEEAAILFANGQIDMVQYVLQGAIEENTLGHAALTVWAMLFDLLQISGKREEFDNLSIDYANKFETSPPTWIEKVQESQTEPAPAISGVTPTVPFSGKLNDAIVKQLERAQNLAENNLVLRLEFIRVTEVDPIGCGILLSVLKKLQKSGNDLILVGALELTQKIRAILEVGRRDETEAPWLLLLEILRLLNLEKDFEEASIDYCVTFEVSPPAFVAPKNKVTTALEEIALPKSASEHFMMPAIVEGRTDQLIHAIANYAAAHNPAIIDCANLVRVDFNAAAQLTSGLAPVVSKDAKIELHNVNHLVAALFNVMGLAEIVRILPRKS